MSVAVENISVPLQVSEYVSSSNLAPLFLCGDAYSLLREFPGESIDFCMTSPPYWGHREYEQRGIGLEPELDVYVDELLKVFGEVKRVLKVSGSFWLNIGDTYSNKQLVGVPWRLAIALTDRQGWTLRNDVIWNKVKGGPDTSRDRLRNVHEYVFHFVKCAKGYFYDADAIRKAPRSSRVVNGAVVSATGVRGVRYRRQIELATALSDQERKAALAALNEILFEVQAGKLADFRMIIRGEQRTTHSDSLSVSGRARELQQRGFYFLRYDPNGSKPADVWDILPEDTQKRAAHFAPYPEDLCRIPIKATCREGGIVLDPFCGTGTTMAVAQELDRKSIGIDLAAEYIRLAQERCHRLL